MLLNANSWRTIGLTRLDVAAALSNLECALYQATADLGGKLCSYETTLTEPAATGGKEAAPSFFPHVLAAHTITCRTEASVGTVVESDSHDTNHKLQPSLETVFNSSHDRRNETEL